jgi:UDP-N-acetylglucosamine--N-acetylmuramyl-(pentapeptide) pyrophosphoryl-undecaprenol N-acetylglucosamine transferase
MPENERPVVVHQAGEKHLDRCRPTTQEAGVRRIAWLSSTTWQGAYEWADLVICRSGALTVAELAAVGVASVLVPFPHAVDDHQTFNADSWRRPAGPSCCRK